jgi:vanillate O-demethylase ferredoxin subunit
VTGEHLHELVAQPGQFFRWRFLRPGLWWASNPYSLSAPPQSHRLRITAKVFGDHSAALTRLRPGTRVIAEGPYGAMTASRRTRRKVLLIAGGIGITPIASMAAELAAQQRDFELHFSGRTRDSLPFVDELRELAGQRLVLWADDDPNARLSVEALLDHAQVNQPIYVCGPAGLIDAVLGAARKRGWHPCDLHYELFTEAAPQDGDAAFEVELMQSGKRLTVPADRSLLDTLIENGADVMYDCRAGYCGLCSTRVCSGEIEHRDTYLSDADKKSGKVMQVCVSRCTSGRLVLDL